VEPLFIVDNSADGRIGGVPPAVWEFEVSGMPVPPELREPPAIPKGGPPSRGSGSDRSS
jgi:hypothetical protein